MAGCDTEEHWDPCRGASGSQTSPVQVGSMGQGCPPRLARTHRLPWTRASAPPATSHLLPLLLPSQVAAGLTCTRGSGCTTVPTCLPRRPPRPSAPARGCPGPSTPGLARRLLGLPLHRPIAGSQPFATGGLWLLLATATLWTCGPGQLCNSSPLQIWSPWSLPPPGASPWP